MEAQVVRLKQDALRCFNLAIAGCACGALVNLFKLACGYPESEEQKSSRSLRGNFLTMMRKLPS